MSALIKPHEDTKDCKVGSVAGRLERQELARTPDPVEPGPDPVVQALEAEICALKEQLKAQEAALPVALEEAREQAVQAVTVQFQSDEAAALQRLEEGVGAGLKLFENQLGSMERQAAGLALEALRPFFEGEQHRALIEALIAKEVASMRAQSVLSISVSPEDFPDQNALKELAQSHSGLSCKVIPDSQYKSGDMRMVFRLGEYVFSASDHWRMLKSILGAPHKADAS